MASLQISLISSFPADLTLSPFSKRILWASAGEKKDLKEKDHYTCSVYNFCCIIRGLLSSKSDIEMMNIIQLTKMQKHFACLWATLILRNGLYPGIKKILLMTKWRQRLWEFFGGRKVYYLQLERNLRYTKIQKCLARTASKYVQQQVKERKARNVTKRKGLWVAYDPKSAEAEAFLAHKPNLVITNCERDFYWSKYLLEAASHTGNTLRNLRGRFKIITGFIILTIIFGRSSWLLYVIMFIFCFFPICFFSV